MRIYLSGPQYICVSCLQPQILNSFTLKFVSLEKFSVVFLNNILFVSFAKFVVFL